MHEHRNHQPIEDRPKSFWKTPLGWAFVGFAAVAGFFLVTEHTAHVFGWLPWLLILACPLMHFFGHRHGGHGGHRHEDRGESDGAEGPGARDDTKSAHRH